MTARAARGTGRPDSKMSRSDDAVKRSRFGVGTSARQQVQAKANAKRRLRDRPATQE